MNGVDEKCKLVAGSGDCEDITSLALVEDFGPVKNEKDVLWSGFSELTSGFAYTVSTFCESFIGSGKNKCGNMSMRSRKPCEPLGPVYLLRSVRDQVALFQERRGVTPEENNFVNLLAIMLTQTGQAVYGVFTMFLSLLPAAVMFLHIAHFILDRILDLVTTRKRNELIVKASIFSVQIVAMFFTVKFVVYSIFLPILHMQTSIVAKIFLMDNAASESSCYA